MGEREMSQNKSLQSKMPLAMGLSFVAFTTQFGGGFASGAHRSISTLLITVSGV